jgi:hypothetical protein
VQIDYEDDDENLEYEYEDAPITKKKEVVNELIKDGGKKRQKTGKSGSKTLFGGGKGTADF